MMAPNFFSKKPSALFGLLLLFSLQTSAQMKDGALLITAGGATSFTGIGNMLNINGDGTSTPFSYPAIALNTDLLIKRDLSLGLCFSMQEMGYNFTGPYNYNAPNGVANGYQNILSWKDTYNRYNVSARGLYHFINKEHFSMYTGVRVGYTWWSRSSNNPDPFYNYSYYDKFKHMTLTPLSVQAIWGIRYFFTDEIGANLEVGLGAPYLLLLGVSVKLNSGLF
jgi:hypothetical protein